VNAILKLINSQIYKIIEKHNLLDYSFQKISSNNYITEISKTINLKKILLKNTLLEIILINLFY